MEEKYLIDTNVIIGYLDNKLPPNGMQFMHGVVNDIPNISVITKFELLRFDTSKEIYNTLRDFISESMVLDLKDNVVEKTMMVCKQSRIKLPDAIIAATALVHNYELVTRNIEDFKNIADLKLINPWDL